MCKDAKTFYFDLLVISLITVNEFSLTSLVARVHGMLLMLFAFCLRKPNDYFLCTCQVFLGDRTHARTNFPGPRLLAWQGNLNYNAGLV